MKLGANHHASSSDLTQSFGIISQPRGRINTNNQPGFHQWAESPRCRYDVIQRAIWLALRAQEWNFNSFRPKELPPRIQRMYDMSQNLAGKVALAQVLSPFTGVISTFQERKKLANLWNSSYWLQPGNWGHKSFTTSSARRRCCYKLCQLCQGSRKHCRTQPVLWRQSNYRESGRVPGGRHQVSFPKGHWGIWTGGHCFEQLRRRALHCCSRHDRRTDWSRPCGQC